VVTSRYHMPRALKMARDLGMKVCGLAAPAPAGKARIKAWLREAGGWAAYLVKIRQYRQK